MTSIEVICALADEAGEVARLSGTVPFLVESRDQIDDMENEIRFPNIGSYRPDGWALVDDLFCDKGGFGHPDKPALNTLELKAALVVGRAYAIIEEGEFQLTLGVFEPNPTACSVCGGPYTGYAVKMDCKTGDTRPFCRDCVSRQA